MTGLVRSSAPPIKKSSDVSVAPLQSPTTLRQAVVEQLRDAIVSGNIPPGTLLKETALAAKLGVSGTPVREALGDLAAEGLVEIEAHRLKRATPINFADTHDLFRVQTQLWRLGYIWGMPNVGPPGIALLDAAIAAYRDAIAQNDVLAAIRAGHDFHTVFISASANSELLRSTLDRRSLIARFILLYGASSISKAGLGQHEAMLSSFKIGDTVDVLDKLDQLAVRMLNMAHAPGN